MNQSVGEWWMWLGFTIFMLAMLAVDMLVLGSRKQHKVSVKEALGWSAVWVVMAFVFNAALWWHLDSTAGREVADEKALEFFTGYLIEKSLSVDNIFVFITIFGYFSVPPEHQKRVLLYGVLGAIVLRAAMILAGAWLIAEFHWILYLFGIFLAITGIKMLIFAGHEPDLARNPVLRWLRNHLRITENYHAEKFFASINGVRHVTPLFLVLVLIETTDLVFALDSIPAIFAITEDPFIVFTSNLFAIMGLRALYFLLADFAERFHLLKYGLAVVLIFVGLKMLIAGWYKIPILPALGVVAVILAGSIALSLLTSSHPRQPKNG